MLFLWLVPLEDEGIQALSMTIATVTLLSCSLSFPSGSPQFLFLSF
jgi:hypothetical protein